MSELLLNCEWSSELDATGLLPITL